MSLLYSKKNFNKIIVTLFFLFTGFFYLHNITRDIFSGDTGDLVTAACVWGVPHPSGYPLFALLGNIFCHLPLPMEPVSRVALVSALASLVGLYFFYRLSFKVTKNLFIALLSTSILAFSHLFWFHAEIPEVFGLNNFFAIMILYFAVSFYLEKKLHYLYLLAFFTGLSATHHQTIVLVYPAALILILNHWRYIFSDYKHVTYGILFLVLGITPYIYVPIAASHNPPVNWDSASNLHNFIHLVLRKDYQTFGAGSLPVQDRVILASNYIYSLVSLFSYQIIGVAILGAVRLFMKDKRLLIALLIAFLLSGPLFVMYIGAIITTTAGWGILERFYVLSSVVFAFFIPYGLLFIKDTLNSFFPKKDYSSILMLYFLLIPFLLIWYNFPKTDLSKTHIGNNVAADVLNPLPPNTILHLYGDTTTFNTWYAHFVLGKRPDVQIINPPGAGNNIFLDEQINLYRKKNPNIDLKQIVAKTLEDLRSHRRVFATYQIAYDKTTSVLIPKGLSSELIYLKDVPPVDTYIKEVVADWKKLHVIKKQDLTLAESNLIGAEIPSIYANSLLDIADFISGHYREQAKSLPFYTLAMEVDPDGSSAYAGLGFNQFAASHECKSSIKNIQKAIQMYPIWKTYYVQLAIVYKGCQVDPKIQQALAKEYKNKFTKSIDEELKKLNYTF